MSVKRSEFATALKAGLATLARGAAVLGVTASPAVASGTGNTVLNCYGIYFNTDWDQRCGTGGADVTGYYYSIGDCTSSGDRYINRYRTRGNTTSVDGGDCRFQVINVRTSFS